MLAAVGVAVGLSMLPVTPAQALPPANGLVYANACHHFAPPYSDFRYPSWHNPSVHGMTPSWGSIAVPGGHLDCGYEQGWLVMWVSGWKTYWRIDWSGRPLCNCIS